MSFLKKILLFLLTITPFSCGRGPGEYSGLCSADCSTALIATNDMEIKSLIDETIQLDCNNKKVGDDHVNVPFRFKILRPYLDINPDDSTKETIKSQVPAPHISFSYTLINGEIKNGLVNDFQTTCTDSCGVGLLEVTPICKAKDNQLKLLLQSGPISKIIQITIKGATL